MQILKSKLNIDFMGRRKWALVFSTAVILISIFSVITKGMSLGIDFTGGTLVDAG